LGRQVPKELRGQLVLLALQAQTAFKAQEVLLELKVHQVFKARQVLKVRLVILGLLAQRVYKDLLA
jgi:hypothetical protein